jgi:hypothetical protein
LLEKIIVATSAVLFSATLGMSSPWLEALISSIADASGFELSRLIPTPVCPYKILEIKRLALHSVSVFSKFIKRGFNF